MTKSLILYENHVQAHLFVDDVGHVIISEQSVKAIAEAVVKKLKPSKETAR